MVLRELGKGRWWRRMPCQGDTWVTNLKWLVGGPGIRRRLRSSVFMVKLLQEENPAKRSPGIDVTISSEWIFPQEPEGS